MRRTYHVNITATAERDFIEIWEYIAQDDPVAASVFVDALESKIASLAAYPERNPFIPESRLLNTQLYRHLIYHNYRIVYRIDHETVYILRVFHGAKLLDSFSIERL